MQEPQSPNFYLAILEITPLSQDATPLSLRPWGFGAVSNQKVK